MGKINQNAYDFFKEVLSEDEISTVEQFFGNKKMFEAVKKVLCDRILYQGVKPEAGKEYKLRNFAFGLDKSGDLNDEQFGRAMRVQLEALVLVEQQFELLEKLGTPQTAVETTKNPAR